MKFWPDFDEDGRTGHYCIGEDEGAPVAVTCGSKRDARQRARLFAAVPALLEELEAARDVIADAMDNHIYNEADGEEPEPDCQYVAALARIDALILTAKGRA